MIKNIINRINNFCFKFNPHLNRVETKLPHIGTIYGGYDVYQEDFSSPTILSCGLGEDASFDIDMINTYDAKVICLDPTPRAIAHYLEIKKRFGLEREKHYDESGSLRPECYNLKKTNKDNFILINKAIWSKNDQELKLYYPHNAKFVSLSLNKKEKYNQDKFFIAKTITYEKILEDFKLEKIDLLKLDIEGAEIEVIYSILNNKQSLPDQLLVEFDIRRQPSFKNKKKLEIVHSEILNYYNLININPKGDFTYILKSFN